MLKPILNTLVRSVLAAALAGIPLQLRAQTTNQPPAAKQPAVEKKEPAVKKSRSIPFSGSLVAVDKAAKTITVGKRTLQITSETKILKADKPAMLENGVPGEYVTGSYQKADDGKLLAHSVYFGGKTKTKSGTKKD
jgi:hypothetical protein